MSVRWARKYAVNLSQSDSQIPQAFKNHLKNSKTTLIWIADGARKNYMKPKAKLELIILGKNSVSPATMWYEAS